MNPWAVYRKRFIRSFIGADLSWVEKTVLTTIIVMLSISVYDALQGHNIGGTERVHLAKVQAQQDLMAQHVPSKE